MRLGQSGLLKVCEGSVQMAEIAKSTSEIKELAKQTSDSVFSIEDSIFPQLWGSGKDPYGAEIRPL